MGKLRLDILLTERGLADSRALAQRLVMAGQVRVDGQVVSKPSTRVDVGSEISVEQGPPFVSRGGEKLAHALKVFNREQLSGRICADIGASTGGFTDCLLQAGAAKVYAVDVGYGVLHWKLRSDPRVVVMERTNARYIEGFPDSLQLVTIDASFISLRVLLPAVQKWFADNPGEVIALIKPQFEAGRAEVARGEGVVRDPKIHRHVLTDLADFAQAQGFVILGITRSPLLGPKGNAEFLIHLAYPQNGQIDPQPLIDLALQSSDGSMDPTQGAEK